MSDTGKQTRVARRSVIAAALVASFSSRAAAQDGPPLPPPLNELRAVGLTDTDGAAMTLGEALLPERASVISFWATWCAPCAAEARHLARMRERIAPERLNIVGINVDQRRVEARISQFLERAGVNYEQLRGDLAAYQSFGGGAQIVLPRLFIFYPDGRPLTAFGRYVQFVTLRQVDRAVERAMAA